MNSMDYFDSDVRFNNKMFDNSSEKKPLEPVPWENEDRYRRVFECGAIGIVLSSPDIDFKEVNPTFCAMIGYTNKELSRMLFADIIFPDDTETSKNFKVNLHKGEISHYKIERRYIHKNGSVLWGNTTVSICRSLEGEVLYTLTLIEDVTKQKLAEIENKALQHKLYQSQKMEAIGLLASGVAHDLNNILAVIIAYPDLILLDETLSKETRANVETLRNSGKMASEIVRDLLTIARGIPFEKETINLNKAVREYFTSPELTKLKELYPAVEIQCTLTEQHCCIKGSPGHIKKMVMNLVINAVEAIHNKGTVTIKTMNKMVEQTIRGYTEIPRGEYSVLEIIDTGQGIAVDDLDRIFEPFFTRKNLGRSGSGLGLAVVWNTMRDLGGAIEVKSSPQGTIFQLFFPITHEIGSAEENNESFQHHHYKGNGQKVLIIDNEKSHREILSSILKKLDYLPHALACNEEVVTYLQENNADLIIMNMLMESEMSDGEIHKAIRKTCEGTMKIIASGYLESVDTKLMQSMGIDQYITKPYSLENIGKTLKSAFQNNDV